MKHSPHAVSVLIDVPQEAVSSDRYFPPPLLAGRHRLTQLFSVAILKTMTNEPPQRWPFVSLLVGVNAERTQPRSKTVGTLLGR